MPARSSSHVEHRQHLWNLTLSTCGHSAMWQHPRQSLLKLCCSATDSCLMWERPRQDMGSMTAMCMPSGWGCWAGANTSAFDQSHFEVWTAACCLKCACNDRVDSGYLQQGVASSCARFALQAEDIHILQGQITDVWQVRGPTMSS